MINNDIYFNASHKPDPTASKALAPIIKQEDRDEQYRLNKLIATLKYIIELGGYKLVNRIEVIDNRTGKLWK